MGCAPSQDLLWVYTLLPPQEAVFSLSSPAVLLSGPPTALPPIRLPFPQPHPTSLSFPLSCLPVKPLPAGLDTSSATSSSSFFSQIQCCLLFSIGCGHPPRPLCLFSHPSLTWPRPPRSSLPLGHVPLPAPIYRLQASHSPSCSASPPSIINHRPHGKESPKPQCPPSAPLLSPSVPLDTLHYLRRVDLGHSTGFESPSLSLVPCAASLLLARPPCFSPAVGKKRVW